ncbi:hypothetical protein ACFOW1_05075 [Parasediminibacterium paludis]|uniref:DUF7689 domain-containing protein n=1 Tax=Parasediminibacterium paludis TaxID=908966 RepID=A0ABV8PX60_9BACT
MTGEPSCIEEMTPLQISKFWPNIPEQHHLTSRPTKYYNCVSWALHKTNRWIDFYYTEDGNIDIDQSGEKYAKYFEAEGFVRCEDSSLVEGVEKIAIYEDARNDFTHVARQLENGNWTSKLGEYEDIEHYSLDALSGNYYGKPKIFLARERTSLNL